MPTQSPPGFPKFDPVDIIGEALAAQYPNLDLSKLNRMFQNIISELQDSDSAAAAAQKTADAAAKIVGARTGTHAKRIGSSIPEDGTIFVESDRGNVAYQVQTGAWWFAFGEMYGLLAERPTDLGANDVGFIYRASNGLDYRWSGSAWAALDDVRGGISLIDVNRLTKVTAAGVVGESSITDDGTTVAIPEPVDITGARPVASVTATGSTVKGRLFQVYM